MVKVVSCTARHFSKETGMPNPIVNDYPVSKEVFDKLSFGATWPKAQVGFTVKTFGDRTYYKPEFFALIEK